MKLTPKTKVMELIAAHDFMLDFLAGYAPEFEKLRSPIMRATVGRFATLEMASTLASVPLDELMADIEAEIARRGGAVEVGEATEPALGSERVGVLKGIITDLHAGVPLDELKDRFATLLQDVGATEIAEMEQQLVADGLPAEEVKQLCDVHVAVFQGALDEHEEILVPLGHPIDTFRAENRAIRVATDELQKHLDELIAAPDTAGRGAAQAALSAALDKVGAVETHYQRKENQLFPYLERKGVTAPPQVMWSIHDDVRAMIKEVRAALASGEAQTVTSAGSKLVRTVNDMAYKEEKVLFPMTYELLDREEWIEIRRGEADIGYALVEPAAAWPPAAEQAEEVKHAGLPGLALDTGLLGLDQINLMLKHLPVDITFVDEHDQVRYFSDTPERVFPRSPGIIGRKVQLCHPAKSVHVVNKIVQAFKDGEKDMAEFWLQLGGRFVHIRYFAMRDARGGYRGTLEVSQDVTEIRALEGERRLLAWDEGQ